MTPVVGDILPVEVAGYEITNAVILSITDEEVTVGIFGYPYTLPIDALARFELFNAFNI